MRYQATQDVLGVVVCYGDQEKRAAGRQQLTDLSRRSLKLGVKPTHKDMVTRKTCCSDSMFLTFFGADIIDEFSHRERLTAVVTRKNSCWALSNR